MNAYSETHEAHPELLDTYRDIFAAVEKSSHIMLVMHKKPDGDTSGSTLAFSHYLDLIQKPHTVFCLDTLPSSLRFLPGAHKLTTSPHVWNPDAATFDLMIVFDSGDLGYNGIKPYVEKLTHQFSIINIDHHITNTNYGHLNLVVQASSTCEVVSDLLSYKNAMNREIATCLMTGLITDTGGFSNLATTASSIHTASSLLKKGVNLKSITTNALQHRSVNSLKLWGRALERMLVHPSGVLTTAITQKDFEECGADHTQVEGVSNFLNTIDNTTECSVICVFTEMPNGLVRGSLRTTHPLIDVAKFATLLGGGGHKKAAGFTLSGRLHKHDDGWVVIDDAQALAHKLFITPTWTLTTSTLSQQ
ncbi:MAG: DHH family phosphoesterase [Candidatus Kerfeldbacteria bacterium]|nr:DHH family phosphoesterase [Candidatus Kerfeldbacteria bacterium]